MTGPTPKRRPGDRNPEPHSRELDAFVEATRAGAMDGLAGPATGRSYAFLGFLAERRRRKLEQRLAAEHRARRATDGDPS